MSKTLRMIILVFAALDIVLLLAFVLRNTRIESLQNISQEETLSVSGEVAETDEKARESITVKETDSFHDNELMYNYDLYEMQYLYVTVVEGSASEGTNHTMKEVDSYINAPGMTKTSQYLANAIVKAGDEKGPVEGMLGFGRTSANATINVRGRSSTSSSQKSYKLKLFENEGYWNGQRTIALNKHPGDLTKFRNALYYKLMREVPSLISLRTYFVHLFVCDSTSSGDGTGEYKDYGLYTAVEQPNNRFLKNHGLNSGGYLYKANEFEFYRYEDQLRLVTDPLYDEEKFNLILEQKGDTYDHTKLLELLDKINNYSVPIGEIVENYFDLDNILDYMTYNMLMVNPDSSSQNYYIYSPLNTEKWYFICWDGDAILKAFENEFMNNRFKEGEWSKGISMYSNNVLFRRIMCDEEYRSMLTERMEKYSKIFTQEKLKQEIGPLQSTVMPLMKQEPDLSNHTGTMEQIMTVAEHMPEDVVTGYENYQESLKKPLPFYLGEVKNQNGKLLLTWDEAYDFGGELVRYRIQIADDLDFTSNSILFEEEVLGLEKETEMLPQGDYYFRVTAINESGFTRLAYDHIVREGNYDGMRGFSVMKDGTVVMIDGGE